MNRVLIIVATFVLPLGCGGASHTDTTCPKVETASATTDAPPAEPGDFGHAHGMTHGGKDGHGGHGGHGGEMPMHAGLHGGVAVKAQGSVKETVARLQEALADKGLNVFATIDHADNAKKAGLTLRDEVLVIFGNPKVGTPLMEKKPTMGLSLPMKMLVYEDGDGTVYVLYEAPKHLFHRHALRNLELQDKVTKVLADLAAAAAGAEASGEAPNQQ